VSVGVLANVQRFAHAQHENFHTEALAAVLRETCVRDPKAARVLLDQLCGESVILDPTRLRISTQVHAGESGIPDMELAGENHYILVEVKVDAPFGLDQVQRYLKRLSDDETDARLVLLTRHYAAHSVQDRRIFELRWYQLGDAIRQAAANSPDPVVKFLLQDLVNLMSKNALTREKVDPSMLSGLPALMSFFEMLRLAIENVAPGETYNKGVTTSRAHSWLGFVLKNGTSVGLEYARPEILAAFQEGRMDEQLDLMKAGFFSSEAQPGAQQGILENWLRTKVLVTVGRRPTGR
jgi:hypothetical protein